MQPTKHPAPERPVEPDPADCCGEGCVNCIYDIHEAAMERFEKDFAAWHGRQEPGSEP
ncbi:MAG: oxidoreductase-like domain-containing protein [Pseudoxanthomonas sp.]